MAEKELSAGIKDGDGGDTVVERDVIFFGHVEIHIHLADVDVDDNEGFVDGGSDFGGAESFVKDMAIETPVTAEDEKDAFVGSGGGADGFGDLLVGIDVSVVDELFFERLAEKCGSGVARKGEEPLIALMGPALRDIDELLFFHEAVFSYESETQNEDVEVGFGVVLADDLRGDVGETLQFPGGPKV